jgi:hypothetical protein
MMTYNNNNSEENKQREKEEGRRKKKQGRKEKEKKKTDSVSDSVGEAAVKVPQRSHDLGHVNFQCGSWRCSCDLIV